MDKNIQSCHCQEPIKQFTYEIKYRDSTPGFSETDTFISEVFTSREKAIKECKLKENFFTSKKNHHVIRSEIIELIIK